MHDTAYEIGRLFFQSYATDGNLILDIGSMDVNGSLRDFCPEGSHYVGIDLSVGRGVDISVATNAALPFSGGVFDIVVSTSCLEHDAMFWMTFLEMCRVLKEDGYLYLNAPSKGGYHRYPIDAWRFFPDAGMALRDWAKQNNHDIELLESFITENQNDIWNDCVMIFGKKAERAPLTVSERYPRAMNIRKWPNLGDIEQRQDLWSQNNAEGRTMADHKSTSDLASSLSPTSFWVPDYFCPSAWIEHAPFAFWVCEALRPRQFIELGTHYGYSYFAFCQAIDRLGLGTTAYAVDTWQGDEHAGFYDESVFQSVAARNGEKYSGFSTLLRTTFEGALSYFADGSVDLLHIDGRHFYDDVKNDFMLWRPKLAENAVVLFHDTNVREREFGVWKFVDELAAQHPSFRFFHGHGLGILALGEPVPATIAPLIHASRETADQIRAVYAALGGALQARAALGGRDREIAALRAALAKRDEELAAALEAIEAQRHQIQAAAVAADAAAPHPPAAMQQGAPTEHGTAPGDALRRADELLATLQSAQTELSKSWLGREILQAGRGRLQNQDRQQPLSNGRLSNA